MSGNMDYPKGEKLKDLPGGKKALDKAISKALEGTSPHPDIPGVRVPKHKQARKPLLKKKGKPVTGEETSGVIDPQTGVIIDGKPHSEPEEKKAKKPNGKKKDLPKGAKEVAGAVVIDGFEPGTQLVNAETGFRIPDNMTLTGWQLPKEMSEEEWDRAGAQLKRAEGGVQWWYGDWWLKGKEQKWWCYGEGKDKAESLGIDYGTIKNYATVCKSFPLSRRRDNQKLTFSHYTEIAALKTKEQEKILDQIEDEGLSTRKVRVAIAKDKAVKKTKETAFKAEEMGQYAVIYADPPWRFENPPVTGSRAIEKEYPTMTLEELFSLPIRSIAAPDSVIYLWTTNAHLASAIKLLEAWGFEYKANFVWYKDKWGLGYYNRNQHELLLVGRRGDPGTPAACGKISSVIEAPVREHSRKPDEVYDIIDQIWPSTRKIELFARSEGQAIRSEWSVWGNQATATVEPQEGENAAA